MRITPLDVRKQEFNKSMRGYDGDEVRVFLNTLADEYETVLVDNKQIRERVMEQDEKISDYLNMERTLRDTLMTAERVMQETRENANREGSLIIQEAQLKARGILEECRLRTEELRREIVGLRKEKETYLARFRGLAEAQISFIDTHESDFEDLDKRLVDIVDSVVSDTVAKAEAIGTAPVAAALVAPVAAAYPTAEFGAPEVAPVPTAAPVASENDIWRDYDPNPGEADTAAASQPQTFAQNRVVAKVAEEVVAAEKVAEEEVAGNIADLVSESLSET
ncbi:MAG: DivIVA domain-containing protein, partial [Candidatus Krumholzibacteria bacterium]|nr:DivIVA domain-containing protein [Candidatus Krumholzibacteria bacterium]